MHLSESFRRTKIVATIGPASLDPIILREMILQGATTLRLNFSHGDHELHRRSIRLIRQTSMDLGIQVAILQDLQGPKIRLGKFAEGPIALKAGDPFVLTSQPIAGSQERSWVTYDKLAQEVPEGATILLDDGRVEMRVEAVDPEAGELFCRTIVGGTLSDNKGVNFPGVRLSIRAVTQKDKEDLYFGLNQGVDWVALSFVREPSDVLELRELMAAVGKRVPIIVKIEKHEAIEQLPQILALSDGVMVARGDLGVELPAEEVPILQKRMIALANCLGIPVITATQMLDSMAHSPRPTRAEISDVANAILDGTDAVMLSNETAVGKYPVEAVATMARIAVRTEQDYFGPTYTERRQQIRSLTLQELGQRNGNVPTRQSLIPDSISRAVGEIARELDAVAVMTLTKTGATARNVSKFRPRTPILAVTPHVEVARRMQLVWGVRPLLVMDLSTTRQTFQSAISLAQEEGLLNDGDLVVLSAGTLPGVAGSTDLIKVDVVKSVVAQGKGFGKGMVSGPARIIKSSLDSNKLTSGDILVAQSTDASYVEAIKQAAGVITEEEGSSSHAAVIGSRLGVPVLVGVKNATRLIRDGAIVTLNAEKGVVTSGADGLGF
ncbi:pyruvate kinase [Thermostichus vulcanus]|uniref:Pyruvate kinase n=1 Tax=Thermostichus vulcanus str. 'Rupite' TaxID=2813851 RepID=A0ABT0CFI9_THEVL|nr:pyruvate kinase [Thermostichus vulcanus]MCJ2544550.1 pyruvate kinase [Thermostichus vulcanus str. 'Rupite']